VLNLFNSPLRENIRESYKKKKEEEKLVTQTAK
jgi:hypothetical protein